MNTPLMAAYSAEPRGHEIDLSAYRILQEALTNTLKHAGPAEAEVTLTYGADRLRITVTDTETAPAREAVPAMGSPVSASASPSSAEH